MGLRLCARPVAVGHPAACTDEHAYLIALLPGSLASRRRGRDVPVHETLTMRRKRESAAGGLGSTCGFFVSPAWCRGLLATVGPTALSARPSGVFSCPCVFVLFLLTLLGV